MTRKEELEERAKRRIDSIYGTRAEHCMGASYDEYVQEVLEDFQHVEREVLGRVENQAREFSVLYPMDVWRDSSKKTMTAMVMRSFADFLKDQQELT